MIFNSYVPCTEHKNDANWIQMAKTKGFFPVFSTIFHCFLLFSFSFQCFFAVVEQLFPFFIFAQNHARNTHTNTHMLIATVVLNIKDNKSPYCITCYAYWFDLIWFSILGIVTVSIELNMISYLQIYACVLFCCFGFSDKRKTKIINFCFWLFFASDLIDVIANSKLMRILPNDDQPLFCGCV